MNLIFPIIALLFILCLITVHKIKKCIVVMKQAKNQVFQVSLTDRRNLSEDAEEQQPQCKIFRSEHDMSLCVKSDQKMQKALKKQSSKARHDHHSKKEIQADVKISVSFLR